jgi:hypothetical protein
LADRQDALAGKKTIRSDSIENAGGDAIRSWSPKKGPSPKNLLSISGILEIAKKPLTTS